MAQDLTIQVAGHPSYIQAALEGRVLLFCTTCHYMVWCKPQNMDRRRLAYYHNAKDGASDRVNRVGSCNGMWLTLVDCPSEEVLKKALAWMDATIGPPVADPEDE